VIPFVAITGERLGPLLRRRRYELGLSVYRVVAETGISRYSLGMYERQNTLPQVPRLELLGIYYGIPDEDLFTAYNEQKLRLPNAQTPGIHGTWAEAQAHYARGGKPCEPCRIAANDYNRLGKQVRRRLAGIKPMSNATGFTGVSMRGRFFAYRIRNGGYSVFVSGFWTARDAWEARLKALDEMRKSL
jgi:transcriptional regulator with XRE-family HTH domain